MITLLDLNDDFEILNLPNGLLFRGLSDDGPFTFVPEINWDDENLRFINLPKRRLVITQKSNKSTAY